MTHDPLARIAAQAVAEAESITAGRHPGQQPVDFDGLDRTYTSAFAAGYALAVDWFTQGAPTSEARALCTVYHATKSGGPAEEATHFLDATHFPSLLAHLAGHLEVFDGEELKAERGWRNVNVPKAAVSWPACEPTYDGFLMAVHHVTEG